MKRGSAWDRWVGLCVRAYPRQFRRRFGRDLAAQYPRPERGTVRAGFRVAADLVRGGIGARIDDARRRPGGRLDGLRTDAVHAVRSVRRRPLFAAMVVATLALAAGLNAAVFAILDTTLLRPLPYPADRDLVSIGNLWTGFTHASVSLPEYVDYSSRSRSFASMAVYSNSSINLAASGGAAERVQGTRATASLFGVLGVGPLLGRPFTVTEDATGASVAVLSHAFWMRRYGGDAGAIGRTLETDGGAAEIVGVMPASFEFPSALTDVWIPMNLVPGDAGGRGAHNRRVIARLAPGVSLDQAQDEMRRIASQLQQEYADHYPPGSGWGIEVVPLRDRLVGDLRAPLQALMIAVAFVLLIACANVANLMVARTTERSREIATRTAFGASRGRLVRQTLFEGLLTGAGGGLAGLLLAAALFGALQPWLPQDLPRPVNVLSDLRVIAFSILVTAGAGALTAALTAIRATRMPAVDALKGARATADAHRARALLTTAQVSLAVLLLVCAGFALRSFVRLLAIDPGLRTDHVATARITLSGARYPDAASRLAFFDRVQAELEPQPGVVGTGAVSMLPLTGQTHDWTIGVEGYVPPVPGVPTTEQARIVHGEYFTLMGIQLRAGRLFAPSDHSSAPHVVIVSELLARKYWKDGDAVGRRVRLWGLDSDEPWATVVGVVADIRHFALEEAPVPFIYFPLAQRSSTNMTLVARLDPGNARGPQTIADAVRAVDIQQPTWSPGMMDDWLGRSVAQPRFNLVLLSIFAVLAILLAAVGVYGVMAFAVSRRTRELGIRLALGAQRGSLLRFVLSEAAWLAGAGILLGSAGALAAGQYLRTLFHDLQLSDPLVLTAVPAGVFAVALLASYLPARRAMTVDPVQALRAD
jgi:putative ABC transport system permease protein